ncbi:MAG: sugar phosphate isomerase/epimerase [Armatimonadetes bacterium]|nr:sugar phosphate isomerase/epimerase [Armatimonadota bacterium]
MDIICASICYRGYAEDEVAATCANAPAIGYRLMEIHGPMVWSVEAVDRFDLTRARAMVEPSGMRCVGIYTPGWGGSDEADVRRRAAAIARCAELTAALGGDHVTSTGAQPRGGRGALERVADCAAHVLELLPAELPVRLALEPHFGNVLQQPEDFRFVLDRLSDPRLGICVDTGHFHSAQVCTVDVIREFADRLVNVHLKDHVGATSVGIGRGEVDLPAVVAALREVGYSGGLTVELEVEDPENLPRYTHEAYVYLSGLLGQKL